MRCFLALSAVLMISVLAQADPEWPRWRGPAGDGAWNPPSLPSDFDQREPQRVWSSALGKGYGGVTIAQGRVYVMDRLVAPTEVERVSCLDLQAGKLLWRREWPVSYGDMGGYATGPRASVTLADGKAYLLGATGMAWCLNAETGDVHWRIDTVQELKARVPQWGFAASPWLLDGAVVLHLGAEGGGSVVAVDSSTGKERWRGGEDAAGYCTPELIEHQGRKQLIQWGPEHVQSLHPQNGKVIWSYPYKITYGVSIAQPLYREGLLLVSGYWHGTKVIVPESPPKLVWEEEKKLCGLMSSPLYKKGLVYLLDKNQGLSCFELRTGKILWQDNNQLTPKDRNPHLSLVWLDEERDLVALLNASGELIYARLLPDRAEILARHQVIGKTWAHPAFTNDTIVARSDTEIAAWKLW